MATNNPTSSYGTYLLVKGLNYASGTWTAASGNTSYVKLIDIKDFPDLGGEPETLETTTLSDKVQTNILGIQSLDTFTFTANYTLADYIKLKALETYIATNGHATFELWFCPAGISTTPVDTDCTDGQFQFKGDISSFVAGKGVNEVKELTISISASTEITQLKTLV